MGDSANTMFETHKRNERSEKRVKYKTIGVGLGPLSQVALP